MGKIEIFFDNKNIFDLITNIYLDLKHKVLEFRDKN
jgi:hypothetical protein